MVGFTTTPASLIRRRPATARKSSEDPLLRDHFHRMWQQALGDSLPKESAVPHRRSLARASVSCLNLRECEPGLVQGSATNNGWDVHVRLDRHGGDRHNIAEPVGHPTRSQRSRGDPVRDRWTPHRGGRAMRSRKGVGKGRVSQWWVILAVVVDMRRTIRCVWHL
jgi:hypothetical protein